MFKPMLAPNEQVDIQTLKYPLFASYKIDGLRCIFQNGKMFTRALKLFPNIQLKRYFEFLLDYTRLHNIILDGEFYAKSLSFPELSGLIRRLDDRIPSDFQFLCFDAIKDNQFNTPFINRIINIPSFPNRCLLLEQRAVYNPQEIMDYYEEALNWGCDGLILRSIHGHYKCGRGTLKEGLIYKLKPFQTFDGKIIDIVQATVVDPSAEKKVNELGRSVTSKKIGDRIPIPMAADFVVLFNSIPLKVTIALTHEEKKTIWANRQDYIGKMIEYKGMLVGAKDLPRHAVFLRFREDKE